ncbi:Tom22p [Cyberlindnera jadinii NRRL Y-1542]|uniref:Mitochondrial import translocase, subunit Tom22 n=1 Tax=Cyberlindnera jadinii (strain ATCC 18201 / CBS 1600 / BCRC 20928 / JCM 3617 / NBRC 0987 / NRRL Y-1542) TaxID=983966 RepID=A0A1E4RXP1_CYBJN|nr:mitochondrial import translocase, subunit Tom22 [Cyberlindnera jadinii NRRL Y-1542]ODV72034.1 mitochondrial import translocase, subunit Tom22 [Cyberlindnera jadinii NRRL Y-1542]
MVKLTQVEDELDIRVQDETLGEGPIVESEKEEEYDDEDDEDEDDFDEDETIYERIVALKDIVPPQQRDQVSGLVSGVYSTVYSAVSKAGNITWVLTTSALLLGVPLSLSILAEQQLMELEKEFKLQQGANDILASGDQPAAAAAPATA